MHFHGLIVGLCTFIIIGILHPVVVKAEYYFGTGVWPVFLISGLASICFSIFSDVSIFSILMSVMGFSLLWSIRELFEQKKRVGKGWFPENPNKKMDLKN